MITRLSRIFLFLLALSAMAPGAAWAQAVPPTIEQGDRDQAAQDENDAKRKEVTQADRDGAVSPDGKFEEKHAKAVMEHYNGIADEKRERATEKIEKVKTDIKEGTMSLDAMDGGADPGEVLGNHMGDISTMLGEIIWPFSDCMDATPIVGFCAVFDTSCNCESETTYGQICIVIELIFFCIRFEASIYWSYRMPVQKVETNRSYRSGYWFKPIVSVMQMLADFITMDEIVSTMVGLDMGRGQRTAAMGVMLSNLQAPKEFTLNIDVDSDLVELLKDRADDLPRPDELKFRNLELAPGAQANAEYHVMEEYAHLLTRTIWGGWKYHFKRGWGVEKTPYLPWFSEGQGFLSGRFAMFSYLGFFPEMLKFELSPMRCMWKNSKQNTGYEHGRTGEDIWARFSPLHVPLDEISAESPIAIPIRMRNEAIARVNGRLPNILGAHGTVHDGCLGINGGSWLPLTTRTAHNYIAQTASQNFLKGTFAASTQMVNFINARDFYSFEIPDPNRDQCYDCDLQDDRTMWVRNDRMNLEKQDVGECYDTEGESQENFQQWQLQQGEWGNASENQSDDDPFFAVVEWRRFRTCPPNLDVWMGPSEEWRE